MSDLIRIVDLEVWTQIGVPDEERAQPQRLLLTLEMEIAGLQKAAATDDLNQTVNYDQVAQRLLKIASARPRQLLETLAEEMARDLLQNFPLQGLQLELKKFILKNAAHVSLKVRRP